MGSINQFLTGLGTGASIKDYQHASRIFVDDNFRLSPKYGFLFHVAIDLNTELTRLPRSEILELGMLVKSVNLPKYTVDTKTYNAYNRVNIVQNKLKYDPVTITFHDDSANVIRDLWYDYMSYYYRDTDYTEASYTQSTKYNERQTQDWGYKPARYGTSSASVERMIRGIRIYSLHQKRFTEYTLINPTITSFQHGQHNTTTNDLLENTMTLSFETVLYKYGYVVPGDNTNFATLHYDKTPSPLTPQGGGTNSILGPGGLLNAADVVVNQLGQNPPNVLGAGLAAYMGFQNYKKMDIKQAFGNELQQIGRDILLGNNPMNRMYVPTLAGTAGQGIATPGQGLFGSVFGSQGGAFSPTGATNNQTPWSTAGTRTNMIGNQVGNNGAGGNIVSSNGAFLATPLRTDGGGVASVIGSEDGSQIITYKDGGTVTLQPDGSKFVETPGGYMTTFDSNNKEINRTTPSFESTIDKNSGAEFTPYTSAPLGDGTTNINEGWGEG